jgi:hypothetical protein
MGKLSQEPASLKLAASVRERKREVGGWRSEAVVVGTFPPPPKASARLAEATSGREGGRSAVSSEPEGSHYILDPTTINAEPAEIAEPDLLCGFCEFCVERRDNRYPGSLKAMYSPE